MRKIFPQILRIGATQMSSKLLHFNPLQRKTALATSLVSIGVFGFSSAISLNDYYELTITDDFKEGEMREFQVGPKKEDAVLICKVEGRIYAVSNSCPHYGAPLSTGLLVGDKVKCPWHNAAFSVRNGAQEEGPMFNGLQTFPVEVNGNQISVRIPKDLLNKKRVLNMATRGDDPTHYLIIGGGPAGLSAAESLRQGGFQGRITILTAEPNLPYDRTPISKGLLGQLNKDFLTIRNQDFLNQYGIEVQTSSFVESVDTDKAEVHVKGGQKLSYDKLLIASGGSARKPKAQGLNLKNVFTLRTFQDAEAIRDVARNVKNIVIVGASFIGLETASAIKSELKDAVNITVIGSSAVPFENILGREVGKAIQALHEQNGIKFVNPATMSSVKGDGAVNQVLLSSGKHLDADLVILGTGIEPNTSFVNRSQLQVSEQNGGIVTDVFLKARENVFVAGDVARYIAAMNMLGRPTPLTQVPYFWTRHFNKTLQYSGVGNGFDEVIIDGDVSKLEFIAYYARRGRIVASASLGVPNAQQIIGEALKLNAVPSAAEFKKRKVTLEELKQTVAARAPPCNCKRAGDCQSQKL